MANDAMPAPEQIACIDLTVPDAGALRDFYRDVTGCTASPVPMGDYRDYCMNAAGGQTVAGICHALGENADLPAVQMVYIAVAGLDAALRRAQDLGGKLVGTPKSAGGNRFCVIQDLAGAYAALYEKGVAAGVAAAPRPARAGLLPALTGLRFFLALWVIVDHLVGPGHAFEPFAQMLPHPLYMIVRGGYLAVTTFFVLSGFVLARTYGGTAWNGRNLWKYGVARVARVYPVYLLSLLIVAPFIVVAKTAPASKGWLVAMHLALVQGWFVGHYTVGWNVAAWTLSCEMFFYLMFPLLIAPLRGGGWCKSLAVAALACVLTRLLWRAGVSDNLKPVIHLADFLIGIAASNIFDLLSSLRKRPAGPWLYLPGVAAVDGLIAYPQLLPNNVDLNTAIRPFNALLLIGFGLGGGWIARALSARAVVYMGKASYAMYILHIPLLWWAVGWRIPFAAEIYVGVVLIVSALVYRWIEEPANRYLRARA
jgi:peptidoglycan/LPS O-acetylase OafA/YrhL/predicted enzyme related to lactoylglutathione lyase